MYVNTTNLENASLEEAVQALKGAMLGKVQIGVAKPLPVSIRANNASFMLCFEPVRELTLEYVFCDSRKGKRELTLLRLLSLLSYWFKNLFSTSGICHCTYNRL